MQYRWRVLPSNHKGVLCRKTLTTGRLLSDISPYATWSSTLPWIVLVLTSSCIFFLACFRFSALFRSGPFWHSRIFTPTIWNGIPSYLRLQPAVSCESAHWILWFLGFWVFPFWPGLKNNDGRQTWFLNCKLMEIKNEDTCTKCLPLLENPPVCLKIMKWVVVAISYALISSSALFFVLYVSPPNKDRKRLRIKIPTVYGLFLLPPLSFSEDNSLRKF